MKSRPATRIGLMMTFQHQREVLGFGQDHSTKIWSDEDLKLGLWGEESVRPRKKVLCKSVSGNDNANVIFGEEGIIDIQDWLQHTIIMEL
jgi:hypothetical protein